MKVLEIKCLIQRVQMVTHGGPFSVIGGSPSVWSISRFYGLLVVDVIMTDGGKERQSVS